MTSAASSPGERRNVARTRELSIGTKLAVAIVTVLSAVSALVYTEVAARERANLVDAKALGASMIADLLAASLEAPLEFADGDAVEVELAKLMKNPEVVYAVVQPTDLEMTPTVVSSGTDTPAVEEATLAKRSFTGAMRGRVEAVRPVVARSGAPVGIVGIAFSLAKEDSIYERTKARIFWFSLAITVGTAGMLIAIARIQIVRRVDRLVDAANELQRGGGRVRLSGTSNDELGRLGDAFNAMSDAIRDRETRLEAANARVRELLDHMKQAILAFAPDGTVAGEWSRRAVGIFGRDLEGKAISELLYPRAQHAFDAEVEAAQQWFDVVFQIDPEVWDEIAPLAPAEVRIPGDDDQGRILELDFRPIVQEGRVARVMMLATDVTDERKLAEAVRSQEEAHSRQMAAMRRLVAGGGHIFVSFLEGSDQRIDACLGILADAKSLIRSTDIDRLFHHVHTIKGEAKAFDLGDLASIAERIEDRLSELRDQARGEGYTSSGSVHAELASDLLQARRAIKESAEVFVAASPIGRAALDQVTVSRSDVRAMWELASGIGGPLAEVAARLAARPFGEATAAILGSVPTWAEREGKRVRLEVDGREVSVPPDLARVLPPVLTHLARNALAHGIEPPNLRGAAGKMEVGLVRITCEPGPSGPKIVFEDDGVGLEVGANPHLFDAGYTTRSEASEIAGRGVGLSAVRDELECIGYSVTCESELGRFTRFVIRSRGDARNSDHLHGAT